MKQTTTPYITCMCTSLKESIDQFVSSSTLSQSRQEYSLSNCGNELVCKCYSDGSVKVENFNSIGFLVRMKEEGFKYVSCTFSILSNRRMLILARSDNKLIVLLEGFFENSFNQIENIPIPSLSSITCIEISQFRGGSTLMNTLLVGCYDGSIHVFNMGQSLQEQLVFSHQHFQNCECLKAIGAIKIHEQPSTEDTNAGNSTLVYIMRTDGLVQICKMTNRRNDSLICSTDIQTMKTIGFHSNACALSFCDLIIDNKPVKILAVSGQECFSLYHSIDNFNTLGKIAINTPPHITITSILALRLEREGSDMLSVLFGDDFGQLYRLKITDLNCVSIAVEPKNYFGKPQASMIVQCVMVRRSEKNSIMFTTRKGETTDF